MGLLDILTQLGQATAERARAKEFGADYRQRWQESADKHTLAETQNALSSANLRAKALEEATTLGMARDLYPDLSPDEGLARIQADKYRQDQRAGEATIGLHEGQAKYWGARPSIEEEKIAAVNARAEDRQQHERDLQERRLEASKDRAAMMAAATAGREPGSYTWMMGPDGKMHYVNPKSKQEFTLGGELPGQPPTTDQRNRQAARGQASKVLASVDELSKKINTMSVPEGDVGAGLKATIKGLGRQASAAINVDQDVAEYAALVDGFIPLMARAVGHTGTLTQKDTDSAKALFPRPRESKEIRDRKMARVYRIMGGQESWVFPSQTEVAIPEGGSPTTPAKPRFQILKVE